MTDATGQVVDSTAIAAIASDPADGNGRQKVITGAALLYADAVRRGFPEMTEEQVLANAGLFIVTVMNRMNEIEDRGGAAVGNA